MVLNAAAVESGPIAADGSYGVFSLDYDISNVRSLGAWGRANWRHVEAAPH